MNWDQIVEESRQRSWIERTVKAGGCADCGEPRGDSPYKSYCVKCGMKRRVRARLRGGFKKYGAKGRTRGRRPLV